MNDTLNTHWEREFALGLRERGISGAAIGAATEEVRAHCADTGQSPQEAFGEPLPYAASLDFPTTATVRTRPSTRSLVAGGIATVGLFLAPTAFAALLRGTEVQYPLAFLGALAVVAVVSALLPPLISFLVRHRVLGSLLFGVAFTLPLLPVFFMRRELGPWPALPAALVTGALLVGGVLAVARFAGDHEGDEITDPVTGRPEYPGANLMRWMPAAYLVAATAMTLLNWLGPRGA